MEDQMKQQFKYIKDALERNLDTITILLNQAKALSDIAESLSTKDHRKLRSKLEEKINELLTTVGMLVKQTEELFDLYKSFAETALNNT